MNTHGELVAVGATAEIYLLDKDHVVKLFKEGVPERLAEDEYEKTRAAHEANLPVPRAIDMVRRDDRLGIVLERLEGSTMAEYCKKNPLSILTNLRLLVSLHLRVHGVRVKTGVLVSQEDRLAYNIKNADGLPRELKDATLESLNKMPSGDTLCHGDFQLENIILTTKGPMIIDWEPASIGNPVADIATTFILLSGGDPAIRPGTRSYYLMRILTTFLGKLYLKGYSKMNTVDIKQLEEWVPIIAASLMYGRFPNWQDWLLGMVREGMSLKGF